MSATSNIYAHMIKSSDEKAARVTEKFSGVITAPPMYKLRLLKKRDKIAGNVQWVWREKLPDFLTGRKRDTKKGFRVNFQLRKPCNIIIIN